MNKRKIMMLVYPGCQALDIAGPVDAFMLTNEVCEDRGVVDFRYELELVAPECGRLQTHGGVVRLEIDKEISQISVSELEQTDTFVIAGGFSAVSMRNEPQVIDFIKQASKHASRVASVCTSAFLFAEAGVLNGCKVTTHWRVAALLAENYPEINVTPDALVCKDGDVWSSGGISAGIDLALAIIEDDLGSEVARSVARMMVVYLSRQGGQSQYQFPETNDVFPQTDIELQKIIDLIRLHPTEDLRHSMIAQRFNMTERTLARRFQTFTGMSVARFVEQTRMAHAQIRLEDSSDSLGKVAERSGFGSADSMRRVFNKRLSISPLEYRSRFRSALRSHKTKDADIA